MLRPNTILSDDEIEPEIDESSSENEVIVKSTTNRANMKVTSKRQKKDDVVKKTQKSEFHFEFDDDDNDVDDSEDKNSNDEGEEEEEEENGIDDNIRSMPHAVERAQRIKEKRTKKNSIPTESSATDEEEKRKAEAEFFESVVDTHNKYGINEIESITMFTQLNLSRPLLRAIEASGYIAPTPIQAKVIPLALAGRDVCASAVTGSGKTAAFVLPILERLLFRPRDISTIRVLVVTPTRELALQIHEVLQKLAQFTDVSSCLISGGKKDLKAQEAMLRQCPDIVICTPGRFIDHLRNSQGVSIEEVDVLILDEVDRLLDLGFQEEVEELLKYCPQNRQTLLFSATMTPKVEDLAKLSLRRPIRVKTEASTTTVAPRLIQEFIKIKDTNREREATVLALIIRSFGVRTIVFFETKKDTHRFFVLLHLLNIKVAELHGDMTQTLRYLALEDFKSGRVDVLVCTDVAARGLDIPGIRTVINAEMPRNASTYIHRVGRTARAGCGGRAVTLVSDDRRKVMKEVLKGEGSILSADGGQVLSRSVPVDAILSFQTKIHELESAVLEYASKEKINRKLEAAEREATKAENMIRYEDEIHSRPVRTWYQSEYQKKEIASTSKAKADLEILEAKVGKVEALRLATVKDDYRIAEDEKKQLNKLHRMSRVKRRRLEALKAEQSDRNNENENDDNNGQGYKTKPNVAISVKAVAKRSKAAKRARENQLSSDDFGIGEADLKKARVTLANGKTTVIRQKFATGGLDSDVLGWGESEGTGYKRGKKDMIRMRKESEEFKGFDPSKSKVKKGTKPSNNGFKTKKRYKRR